MGILDTLFGTNQYGGLLDDAAVKDSRRRALLGMTSSLIVTIAISNGTHYHPAMIKSFRDKETTLVYGEQVSRKLPRQIQQRALMKLQQLDAAGDLRDLRIPPSNQLEALKGDRLGQWSIRINDQWRVCFRWEGGNAFDVEIVDYH